MLHNRSLAIPLVATASHFPSGENATPRDGSSRHCHQTGTALPAPSTVCFEARSKSFTPRTLSFRATASQRPSSVTATPFTYPTAPPTLRTGTRIGGGGGDGD